MNARFGKETDTLVKAALPGLAENKRSMESCETHSLLINAPACNNF
jgi:hypothetical protein